MPLYGLGDLVYAFAPASGSPNEVQFGRLGAARALERAMGASAAMDGESEADMQ